MPKTCIATLRSISTRRFGKSDRLEPLRLANSGAPLLKTDARLAGRAQQRGRLNVSGVSGRGVLQVLMGMRWLFPCCAAAWMGSTAALDARQGAAQEAVGRTVVSVRFEVEGRPDTSTDLVVLSDVKIGQPLRQENIRSTLEHLASLDRYEISILQMATVTPEGVDVVFRLTPRHPVRRLSVAGKSGIPNRELESRLRQRYLGVPTTVPIALVATAARQVLQDEGYLDAEVTIETQLVHNPESATLVLHVEAGPVALIKATTTSRKGIASIMSDDEVQRRTRTTPGLPYRRRDIEVSLTALEDDLRGKGLYEAQATSTPARVTGGVELAISINTGPRVALVVLPDEKALEGGGVDDLIPIKRFGSADRDLLEDSKARIESRLKEQGYWKASAPFTRELSENGELLVVTFTVTKGPRYYVDHVEIPAPMSLPAATIRRLIDVSTDDVFNANRYFAGIAKVGDEYVRNGYPFFESVPQLDEVPSRATPSRAYVVLHPNITEGPRVTIELVTVAFTGEHQATEEDSRQILQSRAGQPYIRVQIEQDRAALRTLYLNRGFLKADVALESTFTDGGRRAALTIRINEGPQSRIGGISVVGNEKVSTASIIDEMGLKVGDPTGAQALADAQSRLGRMGVFQQARVASDGDTKARVVANVVELPDTTMAFGGGLEAGRSTRSAAGGGTEDYLEWSPRGSFEIGQRNLGGRNRSVNLYSRVSLKPRQVADDPTRDGRGFGFTEYLVNGTYRERRAFRSETDLVVGITSEQAKRTSFNFIRNGASAEGLRRLSGQTSVSGRYSLDFTRLLDERIPKSEQPLIDRLFPQVRLSTLSTGLSWDRRNSPISATRGTYVSADLEVAARAIGSDVGYIKTFFQASAFHPLDASGRTLLAVRGEIGLAHGVARTVTHVTPTGQPVLDAAGNPVVETIEDLPASRRFFAGGSNTVRGFQLDRLGVPEILTDDGLSIGGNGLIVANAEIRRVLGRVLGKRLIGVGFLDTGNVFSRAFQLDFGRLRSAAGFGARYESPLGSIRLDFGFKLSPQTINGKPNGKPERRWEYHLSIEEAF